MSDATHENDNSFTELAEELEKFLGDGDDNHPFMTNEKEVILRSLLNIVLDEDKEDSGEVKDSLSIPKIQTRSSKSSHLLCIIVFVSLCILLFVVVKHGYCQGKSMKLCWDNNIQDWIFPILRSIRLLALPVIQYYPTISDVHEDTCLVENPLYWDQDVNCTLCQGAALVTLSQVHHFEELFYHKGVPVVIQDAIPAPVSFPALRRLYSEHREDIGAGSSARLEPAPPGLDSLDSLLTASEQRLADMRHCIQWRLLRVSAVRHLRQLFVRPYFISKKTEVSLHRHIYICGDQGEPFLLPMTEFANVWISQHSGIRKIRLSPSSECSGICRPVSALLRPGETLFYNWRYWRPSSMPMDAGLLEDVCTPRDESEESAASEAISLSHVAQVTPSAASHESGSASSHPRRRESPGACSFSDGLERLLYRIGATGECLASPSAAAAPNAHEVPSEGAGAALGEEEAITDCARLGKSSFSEPSVGITFVGSFY